VILLTEPDDHLRDQLLEILSDLRPTATHDIEGAHAIIADAEDRDRVVILGPGLDPEAVLRFAEKAERDADGTATLLVTRTLEAPFLREALRSGVDDVLTLDATADEWSESIARARARIAAEHAGGSPQGDGQGEQGRLVAVFSTKGGCGKSLVASNLAVLAAQQLEQRVALVDLDLQSGDLAIMLQLMPALSIYDAAIDAGRLDDEALEGYLTAHRSGVALLAAPLEPSLAEQVDPSGVETILGLLKTMFPLTVIDGPPLFTDQMLTALDVADEIVLVGSMDVPSIKNLKLAISTITKLGYPREKLRTVLNRADSKVGLRTSEVEKSLGVEIDVQIPSSRDVPLSINQGQPLAIGRPRSPVIQAINQLLPELLPRGAVTEVPRSRFRRR